MDKKIIITFVAIAVLAFSAYAYRAEIFNYESSVPENDSRLAVVTSIYPLYFFTNLVGGPLANVTNLTPAGTEPHNYELTGQDLATIEKSALIIVNGYGLEPWADKIKQNNGGGQSKLVEASKGLGTLDTLEDGRSTTDPHFWLSPVLSQQMVKNIAEALSAADPANSATYHGNAENLILQLASLDQDYRDNLARCERQQIVTAHAAFGYLASTYGLTQIPIAGLSPDAEPSSQQLAAVADFAKSNDIKYIFFESLTSPKLAETIANEVGAQTLVLNPLEGLTRQEEEQNKNYFSIMRDNLMNLKIALACPEQSELEPIKR